MRPALPRRELPSHSVLRSFESAARHQSFTLAAEELQLTQGAISRQIKDLEHAIGTDLFRRVGRGVVLTMAGRNLAADLAIDLANLHRSLQRAIAAGAMGSTLRVACLPTFASRWLIPRLPDFQHKHPDIEISLTTRQNPFDLNAEHFDLAVHFGQSNWPNARVEPLCSEHLTAVVAPGFRDRHHISHINDLPDVPLLHMSSRPDAWLTFFETAQLPAALSLKGTYFDQFNMIIAAALASLGAALLPTYLIEAELKSGTLIQVGDVIVNTENRYFLVTPLGEANPNSAKLTGWMHQNVTRTS